MQETLKEQAFKKVESNFMDILQEEMQTVAIALNETKGGSWIQDGGLGDHLQKWAKLYEQISYLSLGDERSINQILKK